MSKQRDVAFIVMTGAVLILAGLGFYLSFFEISNRATEYGMKSGPAFAVMVDFSIFVFSGFVMYSTRNGKSRDAWMGRGLILMFVVLSVWFNVGQILLSPIVIVFHALPPIMLLLSFEFGFVRILEQKIERSGAVSTIDHLRTQARELETQHSTAMSSLHKEKAGMETAMETSRIEMETSMETSRVERVAEIESLDREVERLKNALGKLRLETDVRSLSEVQTTVFQFITDNNATYDSGAEIARMVDKSKSGVYKALDKLTEFELIKKNGHGYEVIQ